MKKAIAIILIIQVLLLSVIAVFAQETKSQLTTRFDVIRNETSVGGNTRARIANAYQELSDGTIGVYPITASGTDTYTGSLVGVDGYTGRIVFVVFPNDNTGPSTFNLNSIGATNILKDSVGSWVALEAGDIQSGKLYRLYNDGTRWQIDLGGGSGSSLFPTTGTGTATGNVTGDLDGNDFEISNADAVTVTGSGTMRLESGGELGLYRTGNSLKLNTGGTVSIFTGTVSSSEKLTVGLDGEIIVSTNTGTSGQVLTSGGSGEPATWEDPASVGLESVSVTTTGSTITLDFHSGDNDDAVEKMFIGSNTWATSKTLAFSNSTGKLVFNFHFEVTNVAGEIVCSTCIAAASAVSGTWDSGTWTPTEIGKYEMGGTWDGSAWKIKIIGPFE